MKTKNTLTCFNFNDDLKMNIRETSNYYDVSADLYFDVGTRINPKRSFLFISKLLGKHLEVKPDIPKLAGYMLAYKYAELNNIQDNWCISSSVLKSAFMGEDVTLMKKIFKQKLKTKKKPIVIGFAETATGLGHAVFSAFENAMYVHTTREEVLSKKSLFDFEEEHSHATSHRCYLEKSTLDEIDEVFLVDDEITTGNTALNLIKSLNRVYPGKSYKVFALLDWRSDAQHESCQRFAKENGIDIEIISLYGGNIEIEKEKLLPSGFFFQNQTEETGPLTAMSIDSISRFRIIPELESVFGYKYLTETGRFGLSSGVDELLETNAEAVGKTLSTLRRKKKTLVLGSGEFIYIPSRIASYMGDGITYKSYTRSPVRALEAENYPIGDITSFVDDNGVFNYIYNMDGVDEVFIINEQCLSDKVKMNLEHLLKDKGIKNIVFVSM